jgi:deoxyribodipyrimidine photo-lyase
MRGMSADAAPVMVWFRQDLRLADIPVVAAAADGRPVLLVFVPDEATAGRWAPGDAARWWLHHSLAALDGAPAAKGATLHLARGPAETITRALAAATHGAAEVHAGRSYEPWARKEAPAAALRAAGIALRRDCPRPVLQPLAAGRARALARLRRREAAAAERVA